MTWRGLRQQTGDEDSREVLRSRVEREQGQALTAPQCVVLAEEPS